VGSCKKIACSFLFKTPTLIFFKIKHFVFQLFLRKEILLICGPILPEKSDMASPRISVKYLRNVDIAPFKSWSKTFSPVTSHGVGRLTKVVMASQCLPYRMQ
jgi:hypothetical protein